MVSDAALGNVQRDGPAQMPANPSPRPTLRVATLHVWLTVISPQAEHCLEMDSNREYVGRWRDEGDGPVT